MAHAVFYRFPVKAGSENTFVDAWHRLTVAAMAAFGSLGSTLHLAADGVYVAYALWPDRATFERATLMPTADPSAREDMDAALAGAVESIHLEVVDDLLR